MITNKSSERYREGLNYILESVHNGKTLDKVISEISPYDTDLGEYVYTSADDFEKKFIKGAEDPKAKDSYIGEGYSQTFVVNYLNYMLNLEKDTARKNPPNGSILYDLDVDENAETTKEQDEQAESIPQYSINHEQVYDDEEVADSVENDEISNEKTSDVSEEETRIAEGTTELSDE